MTTITQTPVWEMDGDQYLRANNILKPYICEISGHQYALMSKRSQRAYDEKRTKEWQAAIDGQTEWLRLLLAAYDAEEFTLDTPGLSDAAKNQVYYEMARRMKARDRAALIAAREANRISSIDQVKIGDRIYHGIYGYAEVIKINRKTIKVKLSSGFSPSDPPDMFYFRAHHEMKPAPVSV